MVDSLVELGDGITHARDVAHNLLERRAEVRGDLLAHGADVERRNNSRTAVQYCTRVVQSSYCTVVHIMMPLFFRAIKFYTVHPYGTKTITALWIPHLPHNLKIYPPFLHIWLTL